MKTIILLLICLKVSATAHIITASDYQFTPQHLNANVGDTIIVQLAPGSHNHTFTCNPATQGEGNKLPPGAEPFDAPLRPSSPTFVYVLKVPGEYRYWSKPDAPFMYGTITVSQTLPIKFSDFTVNGTNEVLIKWATETEQNVSHFLVRKSIDGTNFQTLGIVAAAGNSTVRKEYSYSDKASAIAYYQIVSIDKDGTKTTSAVRVFKGKQINLTLSPNPAKDRLNVSFNSAIEGKMKVQFINSAGQTVKTSNLVAHPGENKTYVNVKGLTGVFTVVSTLNGITDANRVLIQ